APRSTGLGGSAQRRASAQRRTAVETAAMYRIGLAAAGLHRPVAHRAAHGLAIGEPLPPGRDESIEGAATSRSQTQARTRRCELAARRVQAASVPPLVCIG